MLEVAVVCSDCAEESREVVRDIEDVDRASCPCGYSYVVLSVASYEPQHSPSPRLLTARGGTVQIDGSVEWHDLHGRLHRPNGPARVFPSGRREWFRHGCLHRKGGPAVVDADGRRVWFVEGERLREEKARAKAPAQR